MGKIKEHYSCSLLLTHDLIGGKWKLRILWHILNDDDRYSLLKRAMPDITEKMLTTQLREMENTGLLIRCVITEKPLNVKYTMSSKYDGLRKIISDLCDFSISYGNEHGIEIDE